MYKIIQKRKIWLSISGTLVAMAIISLFVWGLRFGIDFTGGSLLEVKFSNNQPAVTEIQETLKDTGLSSLTVQPMEGGIFILRFQENSEETHQALLSKLNEFAAGKGDTVEELRFDSIGPSVGKELKSKSFNAIIIVLIIIIAYIAFAFRKISKPVASWKYGLAAIIALAHDVLITLGVFAVLGHYYGTEINTPFVAALLTLLGYSINDTIVVFDRIRENLPRSEEDFEGTVNTSVNQTMARSVNTSLTVLLVLFAILFWGGSTIHDFVLALSIGVFVGTYSSIFVASPVLVVWEKMKKN
ncbi:MAG: protein translocase subunit SecF [Patescibacteria group bacterium]|nr:protein translocase subunit SecF [Patescibacteria group bacterium]MDD5554559.1 protein translocase subunit SecF [Patescibacteria group bacterium]